mgnify:CR=1 FL=1
MKIFKFIFNCKGKDLARSQISLLNFILIQRAIFYIKGDITSKEYMDDYFYFKGIIDNYYAIFGEL